MVKVFKIELLIIDHDECGEEGVKDVIENARYPNRCINPHVMNIKAAEVEWDDDHPLNNYGTMAAAYRDLFPIA